MSEDVFRWVITVGVGLSALMTAITTGAMFAMYRTSKRIEEKVSPLFDKAGPIMDRARTVVDEAGPKIQDMIDKASEMTTAARDQIQKLDILLSETTERARLQIDHIDAVVGDTVNRVQETAAAVQNTVLAPVREVNGVVSGLRAAISSFARGNRASVDHATQDEEMFI
jgi:ABC-type transporter Mla subunit MlaD